jgi:hypothetical protein
MTEILWLRHGDLLTQVISSQQRSPWPLHLLYRTTLKPAPLCHATRFLCQQATSVGGGAVPSGIVAPHLPAPQSIVCTVQTAMWCRCFEQGILAGPTVTRLFLRTHETCQNKSFIKRMNFIKRFGLIEKLQLPNVCSPWLSASTCA